MSQFDGYLAAGIICLAVALCINTWRLHVVNKNLHWMRDMFEMFALATAKHVERIDERIDAKKDKQDA